MDSLKPEKFVGEEWFGVWKKDKEIVSLNDYGVFYLNTLSNTGFREDGTIAGKGWDGVGLFRFTGKVFNQEFFYDKFYNKQSHNGLNNLKYKGTLKKDYLFGEWRGVSINDTIIKGTFSMASFEKIKDLLKEPNINSLEKDLFDCIFRSTMEKISQMRLDLPYSPPI